MIYGYARCSINKELQDIHRQIRELKQQGVSEQNIYLEYESGTKKTAPIGRILTRSWADKA